jgi:transposase
VIDVALLGIIRRWHLRDQVSLREISKRLGISRNTVRRYLRAETVEPAYADRRSPTSLDKYAFKLSAWLKTEATKSRKQRRTLKQMHIDLCALGFEGSYDRVAAFARQWKVDQLERVNSASKSTDDVTLSGTNASKTLLSEVRRLIRRQGLRTKKEKSKTFAAHAAKTITGAVVVGDEIRLPNKRYQKIWQTRKALASSLPNEKKRLHKVLRGRLQQASQLLTAQMNQTKNGK